MIRQIAQLAAPETARRMRNACKGYRVLIKSDDLVLSEAGWTSFHFGVEACWEWATRKWHTSLFPLYMSEVSQTKLDETFRVAVRKPDVGTAKQLLQAGAHVRGEDVEEAAALGDAEMVKLLMEAFIKSRPRDMPIIRSVRLEALNSATLNGRTEVVKMLLASLIHDRTYLAVVLEHATQNGLLDFVENALNLGANVQTLPALAFQSALTKSHVDVAYLLLNSGATLPANMHMDAMMTAIRQNHLPLLITLLNLGVDIHHKNDTPVFVAASRGNADTVAELVEAGSKLSTGALYIAAERGYVEVVRVLLGTGVFRKCHLDVALSAVGRAKQFEVGDLLREWKERLAECG
ncbi:hypothetical protein HDV00_009766 [Rhizophlyctis rosea]|nr:hypothetical protein HDV00_009766 [Rhizophlyctis rosea]